MGFFFFLSEEAEFWVGKTTYTSALWLQGEEQAWGINLFFNFDWALLSYVQTLWETLSGSYLQWGCQKSQNMRRCNYFGKFPRSEGVVSLSERQGNKRSGVIADQNSRVKSQVWNGHNGCPERIQAASFEGCAPQTLMQTGILLKWTLWLSKSVMWPGIQHFHQLPSRHCWPSTHFEKPEGKKLSGHQK